MELSRSRIVITGAGGFIGSHLARELIAEGAEVHGIIPWGQDTSGKLYRCWRADLARFDETQRIIREICPDIIYHLCSLADGARDMKLVLPILRNEVIASINVLIAAAEMKSKRIIMAGSLEEPLPGEIPSSPYAAAKAATRSYGQMFHTLYGTPVVFTRIFMTYGPGQSKWKIIPYCILSLLKGEIPSIGSAEREVDWIYISDVVHGLMMIARTPDLEGKSLDLGSGALIRIDDIVAKIQKIANPAIQVVHDPKSARVFEQVVCADVDSTAARLGWRPRISLDQGLKLTVEYFAAHE
jgi:UDP-glucose 4-epimerase